MQPNDVFTMVEPAQPAQPLAPVQAAPPPAMPQPDAAVPQPGAFTPQQSIAMPQNGDFPPYGQPNAQPDGQPNTQPLPPGQAAQTKPQPERRKKRGLPPALKALIWVGVVALVIFLTLFISALIAGFTGIPQMMEFILSQL